MSRTELGSFGSRRFARPVLRAGLVLALALPGGAAQGAETWFAQRVTSGDVPLRVEFLWASGSRFRAETVLLGRPIVTLVNGERYYVIDALAGRGIAIRRSPAAQAADASGRRPFGDDRERLLAEGAERVRSERLAGRLCDVYRVTDARGRRELWVTKDALALPVRLETFDRGTTSKARLDYVDWTRELAIPDAFFEPDPRVALESIDYDDYLKRVSQGPVGPAPVLYAPLLHGR